MDKLTHQTSKEQNNKQREKRLNQQERIINMTNTQLTNEQIQTLSLGPKYAIEREPKLCINELIIDTENAIRTLEPKIQNTYRHLATKQIKSISMTYDRNKLHKRKQHILNKTKKTLQNNNAIMVKADKRKAIVLIKQTP